VLVFGTAALLLALAPLGRPVRAEPGPAEAARPGAIAAAPHELGSIDLQPESVEASVGVPVTLGVRVYDASGALYAGEGTSIFVRMVFLPGSANDPGAAQSFHLSCRTESAGWCSVTYTPLRAGRDVLCARIWGGRGTCDEPVGASERDDLIDVVRVTVRRSGAATPTAPPAPTAAPTPTPKSTKQPAPDSSPTPPRKTPRPKPDASPVPVTTPRPRQTTAPNSAGNAPTAGTEGPSSTASPVLIAGGGSSGPRATPGGAFAGGSSAGSAASPPPRQPDGLGAATFSGGSIIKLEAAAAVATSFGFPIALMVAVALFLILQPRLDERDPKLRKAPRTYGELLLPFEREVDL
jgi:hypothetical protein